MSAQMTSNVAQVIMEVLEENTTQPPDFSIVVFKFCEWMHICNT